MSDVGDYEYNTLSTIVGSDITVPIDIKSQTVTVDMNITGSSIDVPISIQSSAVNVPVSIDAQTVTLDANITNAELDVDINSQTLSEVAIDIVAQSLSTVGVSIDAQTAVLDVSASEVDVNINTQSVDLDVKQGQMQGRRVIYDPTSATDSYVTTVGDGFYVPHGVRGIIDDMEVLMHSTDGAAASVTLAASPQPGQGKMVTQTFTTSNTTDTWVLEDVPFNYFFSSYNSICIWIASIDANCEIAEDNIGFGKGGLAGLPDQPYDRPEHMRVKFRVGEQAKALPIAGTVNNIKLPNQSSEADITATPVLNEEKTLISIEGTGVLKTVFWKISYDDGVYLTVRTDGDQASRSINPSRLNTRGHNSSTPDYPLTLYTSGGTCYGLITKEFPFQRTLKIIGKEVLGNSRDFTVSIEYELIG